MSERRRLGKHAVETLLTSYDANPEAALTLALRVVLDAPAAEFDELITAAHFPAPRTQQLLARDTAALDQLVRELNEVRTLAL
ncbi:MAG: hypothetical protein WCO88_00655 [Actinomycetota bacterium]